MKERPVLFSGEMMEAVLERRKTQTRRIIKNPPQAQHLYLSPMWGTSAPNLDGSTEDFGEPGLWRVTGPDYPDSSSDDRRCPFGVPGDTLWCREGWRPGVINAGIAGARMFGVQYRAGYAFRHNVPERGMRLFEGWGDWPLGPTGNAWGRWRPSIHMPRWASRATLEVTEVRAERLQDIAEEDARAEGFASRAGFIRAWIDMHGREGWTKPKWVWVVSFDFVEPAPES